MCVRIWREVARARRRVDDVVADRLGQQPQRGDRRAQVVRDGGDQVAPGALRARRACAIVALAARASSASSSRAR